MKTPPGQTLFLWWTHNQGIPCLTCKGLADLLKVIFVGQSLYLFEVPLDPEKDEQSTRVLCVALARAWVITKLTNKVSYCYAPMLPAISISYFYNCSCVYLMSTVCILMSNVPLFLCVSYVDV